MADYLDESSQQNIGRKILFPPEYRGTKLMPILGCTGGGCLSPILFVAIISYIYSDYSYDFPQGIPFVVGFLCCTIALVPIGAVCGLIVGWVLREVIEAGREAIRIRSLKSLRNPRDSQ